MTSRLYFQDSPTLSDLPDLHWQIMPVDTAIVPIYVLPRNNSSQGFRLRKLRGLLRS